MSEQRLIDANKEVIRAYEDIPEPYSDVLISFLRGCEPIDPESLPIVQQLRAELERVKAERDAVTKSRAKLVEYELTVCEEFCYGDAQHDIPPCEWLVDGKCALREWVKEYA